MTVREYWITIDPATKPIEPQAKIKAINALHALDSYAIGQGFGAYEDLDPPLSDWVGVDQYGVWGTFTNVTIWAIPCPPRPRFSEMETFKYEGLWIVCSRDRETGRLIVNINSEGTSAYDNDNDGEVEIEVSLDGGVIYDRPTGPQGADR